MMIHMRILAAIDGLYFHRKELIAIPNGPMSPRVLRMPLDSSLRTITCFEILERRNPLFEGLTTGVLDGDNFYYMANVQGEDKPKFDPIAILKLHL